MRPVVSRLRRLRRAALVPLAAAAALAGCGLGPGETTRSPARIAVTDRFGTVQVGARIIQQIPETETIMRATQRAFDVETRYGGGFVQAIDGRAGGRQGGRPVDWFLYVNGAASDVGATRVDLHGGDHIWWDRHEWGATAPTTAVVGAFPAPFTAGKEGKRYPVVLQCAPDADAACDLVAEKLSAAGASPSRQTLGTGVETEVVKVLVGTWPRIRADAALRQADLGRGGGGIYARFSADGARLELLDPRGAVRRTLGAGAGLVAASAYEEQAPTWAVTGTDLAGVRAAAAALEEPRLRNRIALAVDGGSDIGLPVVG